MGSLLEEVNRKYEAACRLQSVEFEITHRCPCSCPHCYLTARSPEELTTGEIDALFVQLREEGVIDLAITGGDPLAREDLPEVLELAHRERFLVSLLTTGVLVGPDQVRLFSRAGVGSVEMSLLGATAQTHDRLMRHAGAFDKTLGAARLLREAGIEVVLKVTALADNYRDIPAMRALAANLGVGLAVNMLIAPGIDGDPGPQRSMLTAAQAAELEKVPGGPAASALHGQQGKGAVLTCQAGRTFAGVAPDGQVLPCIAFRRSVGNIREHSLQEIWHDTPDPFLLRLRALKSEDVTECWECASQAHCRRCPGIAYCETREVGKRSPSACRLVGRENVASL